MGKFYSPDGNLEVWEEKPDGYFSEEEMREKIIGYVIHKNDKEEMKTYTKTALWCNLNNAHIEDKGLYYEVVENVIPEPTKEEKLIMLDNDYETNKQALLNFALEAMVENDTELQQDIQEELQLLKQDYDKQYQLLID